VGEGCQVFPVSLGGNKELMLVRILVSDFLIAGFFYDLLGFFLEDVRDAFKE